MKWSRRRWLAATGLTLLGCGTASSLALIGCGKKPHLPEREDDGEQQGRYVALIVAAPRHEGMQEDLTLRDCVSSAQRLAKALRAVHYDVTTRYDDEAKADDVFAWLKQNTDPDRIALSIVILSGHGCQRDGEDYFLTYDATLTAGGVRLSEIDKHGDAGGWPLLCIVDSCRIKAPQNPHKEADGGRGLGPLQRKWARALEDSRGSKGRAKYRTRLHSARQGKRAPPTPDLIGTLADGLTIDPEYKKFKADPFFNVAGLAPEGPLTIKHWLHYGITNYVLRHNLEQETELVLGYPALDEPLAQANPPGPPVAAPADAVAVGGVDLLPRWRPQHGRFLTQSTRDGNSWKVRMPPEGAGEEPWIGGFIHDSGDGFPVQQGGQVRALFVEVLALPSSPFAPPGGLTIALDAKFVKEGVTDRWIGVGGKSHHLLRAGQPVWCKIPLVNNPAEPLNYLGVSHLSAGCVVELRQAFLASASLSVPAGLDRDLDLMRRWWICGQGQKNREALGFALVRHGKARAVKFFKGPGWVGGVLAPVWVAAGQEVVLDVENEQGEPAQFLFECKEDYKQLGAKVLVADPGQSRLSLRLNWNGQLNFLAVSQPSGPVTIRSIILKPPPVNVAPRKQ